MQKYIQNICTYPHNANGNGFITDKAVVIHKRHNLDISIRLCFFPELEIHLLVFVLQKQRNVPTIRKVDFLTYISTPMVKNEDDAREITHKLVTDHNNYIMEINGS